MREAYWPVDVDNLELSDSLAKGSLELSSDCNSFYECSLNPSDYSYLLISFLFEVGFVYGFIIYFLIYKTPWISFVINYI